MSDLAGAVDGAFDTSSPAAPVTTASGSDVRVRFCPSPTGTPHVGLVRTALFNWAYARHTGGTFVVRIEDTDPARDSEESYHQILDALHWLGIDWDEGVEVGGPQEPYRQSLRREIYADVVGKLVAGGHVYESFSTPAEVEARHLAAGRDPKLGYDNVDRDLAEEAKAAFRAEGREPVLRLRMPDEDLAFDDLVRGPGDVPGGHGARLRRRPGRWRAALHAREPRGRRAHGHHPCAPGGGPAVLHPAAARALPRARRDRGHDVRAAVRAPADTSSGRATRKLSKRDPQSNLFHHRDRGFVPEGLLNYLALLGWAIAADRDVFTMAEMVRAFDIVDVNSNPARFDQAKADAINAEHLRRLAPEDFAARLVAYLGDRGVLPVGADGVPDAARRALVEAAAPLLQTRVQVLAEAVPMLSFLLVPDGDLVVEDDAFAAVTKDAAQSAAVLDASAAALADLPGWDAAAVEAAVRTVVVERLGIKPKFAFTPLRVAVTGRRVSPPLFESMEILGRAPTLARVAALRTRLPA